MTVRNALASAHVAVVLIFSILHGQQSVDAQIRWSGNREDSVGLTAPKREVSVFHEDKGKLPSLFARRSINLTSILWRGAESGRDANEAAVDWENETDAPREAAAISCSQCTRQQVCFYGRECACPVAFTGPTCSELVPELLGDGAHCFGVLKGSWFTKPHINKLNLTTCAVVGSAAPSGPGLRAKIDSASTVIRFNDAPTKGHEAKVGTRTDIRIQNRDHCGFAENTHERCLFYSMAPYQNIGNRVCLEKLRDAGSQCSPEYPSVAARIYAQSYWLQFPRPTIRLNAAAVCTREMMAVKTAVERGRLPLRHQKSITIPLQLVRREMARLRNPRRKFPPLLPLPASAYYLPNTPSAPLTSAAERLLADTSQHTNASTDAAVIIDTNQTSQGLAAIDTHRTLASGQRRRLLQRRRVEAPLRSPPLTAEESRARERKRAENSVRTLMTQGKIYQVPAAVLKSLAPACPSAKISGGFYGALMAAHLCAQVDVYLSTGAASWYYHKALHTRKSFENRHQWASEQVCLRKVLANLPNFHFHDN